jgi:hypothetical protein
MNLPGRLLGDALRIYLHIIPNFITKRNLSRVFFSQTARSHGFGLWEGRFRRSAIGPDFYRKGSLKKSQDFSLGIAKIVSSYRFFMFSLFGLEE